MNYSCGVCGKLLVRESDLRGLFPIPGAIMAWMCADEEDEVHQAAYRAEAARCIKCRRKRNAMVGQMGHECVFVNAA